MVLFNLVSFVAISQSIPDSEFLWTKTQSCHPDKQCIEIFLKVEKDPQIAEYSATEFETLLTELINELKLTDSVNTYIKLKLLFLLDSNLCVNEIGAHKFELEKWHISLIENKLNSITILEFGKQRGVEVNCQGILYINVENGQFHHMRNLNFILAE